MAVVVRELGPLLAAVILALPVVGGEGELLGIITVDDVLNLILPMIWKKRAVRKFI